LRRLDVIIQELQQKREQESLLRIKVAKLQEIVGILHNMVDQCPDPWPNDPLNKRRAEVHWMLGSMYHNGVLPLTSSMSIPEKSRDDTKGLQLLENAALLGHEKAYGVVQEQVR